MLDELTRIGQTVNTAEELAERSARLVGVALEASGTAYGLLTKDGTGYQTARMVDVRPPLSDWLVTAAPAERRVFRRWRAGEGSILERFEPGVVSDETLELARTAGITAYAAIPIRVDDELAGGIVAYFDRSPDELHVNHAALDSVARIVGISLANFRHRERFEGSEARYRTLFEASPDAYLLCDAGGTIVEANGTAEALYGRTARRARCRRVPRRGPRRGRSLAGDGRARRAAPQRRHGPARPTGRASRARPRRRRSGSTTRTAISSSSAT